jgi:hypothetical protein
MRIPASFVTRSVAVLSLALGAAAVSSSAQAAAWGSLRSPFSYERQLEERLNYAAQVREEQHWGFAFEASGYPMPEKIRRASARGVRALRVLSMTPSSAP